MQLLIMNGQLKNIAGCVFLFLTCITDQWWYFITVFSVTKGKVVGKSWGSNSTNLVKHIFVHNKQGCNKQKEEWPARSLGQLNISW